MFSIALALFSFTHPAHASAFTMSPGSACQPATSSTSTSLYYSKRYVSSTSATTMDCPVAFDTYDGYGPVSASAMYVVDNSGTAAVSCSLVRFSSYSSTMWWTGSSPTSVAGHDSGGELLTIGALGAGVGMNYLYFSCSIPATTTSGSSGVGSYYVD